MKLLKSLLLLSFIIYPSLLVTHDAEELLFVHENSPFITDLESIRLKNIPFKKEIIKFKVIEGLTADDIKNPLVIRELNSNKVEVGLSAKPRKTLQHESLSTLYVESELLDSNSFGEKLHHLIEAHYADVAITESQYSHYLIDRLIIESDARLSYAEKEEKIQYLMDSAELSVTEDQMKNEMDFLMNTLATLPLGMKGPQWREGWYSQLHYWSETNSSVDITTTESDTNDHHDWRARVSDYQQVRDQLRQQLGDEQEIFEVAQEDLRNSYFTDKEVTLITITDNTIDLLNNSKQ